MSKARNSLEHAIEFQAAQSSSPLYAHLLEGLLADLLMGGITAELLEGVSDQPLHDAIPLRYLATAHRLALAGNVPELAQWYPSCGGVWHGENIADVIVAVARKYREEFATGMRRNVQTNEVGRAPVLASSFALIASRHGLPLDLLEIGSSAGLLSRWDRYYYDTGRSHFGDRTSPLGFGPQWWRDSAPLSFVDLRVARRRGSDIAPIDATSPDGRLTMLSFIWPDQLERIDRLRAALDVAQAVPMNIDRADAGDWLTLQLVGTPPARTATVVFHSIVWQYLPKPTRDRVRTALYSAATRATHDSPLFWLRMEPATAAYADVRLTTWPGGNEEMLAHVGYHGADIEWLQRD